MSLTRAELVAGFRSFGVDEGDTLLVHSSYKSLGDVDGGVATVVEALLESVGPSGTLIAPTFNFAFCEGEPFDARTTPSRMGAITEVVRADPRATRVAHPIYSFAVIGARAQEAAAISDPSSYGRDSLFGKLRDWDGKIAVIGLSWNDSMTFFHHVEEMLGVPYRYMKSFTGPVTDVDGTCEERTVTMYVRDLDAGIVTMVDPMGRELERAGVARVGKIGEADVRVMRAREIYEFTAARIEQGDSHLLYVVESAP
jgi:aminoglycoside 3-N-acetyltransferase